MDEMFELPKKKQLFNKNNKMDNSLEHYDIDYYEYVLELIDEDRENNLLSFLSRSLRIDLAEIVFNIKKNEDIKSEYCFNHCSRRIDRISGNYRHGFWQNTRCVDCPSTYNESTNKQQDIELSISYIDNFYLEFRAINKFSLELLSEIIIQEIGSYFLKDYYQQFKTCLILINKPTPIRIYLRETKELPYNLRLYFYTEDLFEENPIIQKVLSIIGKGNYVRVNHK